MEGCISVEPVNHPSALGGGLRNTGWRFSMLIIVDQNAQRISAEEETDLLAEIINARIEQGEARVKWLNKELARIEKEIAENPAP